MKSASRDRRCEWCQRLAIIERKNQYFSMRVHLPDGSYDSKDVDIFFLCRLSLSDDAEKG